MATTTLSLQLQRCLTLQRLGVSTFVYGNHRQHSQGEKPVISPSSSFVLVVIVYCLFCFVAQKYLAELQNDITKSTTCTSQFIIVLEWSQVVVAYSSENWSCDCCIALPSLLRFQVKNYLYSTASFKSIRSNLKKAGWPITTAETPLSKALNSQLLQ